jgi:hypothetical protein
MLCARLTRHASQLRSRVYLTIAAVLLMIACSRDRARIALESGPDAGRDSAPDGQRTCSPLTGYCASTGHDPLWGLCDSRWDREIDLACGSGPTDVRVKVFADCHGYRLVAQYGVDYSRMLYFDANGALFGVDVHFAIHNHGQCYGVVPLTDVTTCVPSGECGGSPL